MRRNDSRAWQSKDPERLEEEARRRAVACRYRRAQIYGLSYDDIRREVDDIVDECTAGWFEPKKEGDSLCSVFKDDDIETEFTAAFRQLDMDAERLAQELWDNEDELNGKEQLWDDVMVVCFGDYDNTSRLTGYDDYLGDYYGIVGQDDWAREASEQRLMRLTKEQLIRLVGNAVRIAFRYIDIQSRTDSIMAEMMGKRADAERFKSEITKVYSIWTEIQDERDSRKKHGVETDGEHIKELEKRFENVLDSLPSEMWVI